MALIIAGLHRSGTSLLMNLCNSHPDITLTNETGIYMALGKSFPEYARFMYRRWREKRNAIMVGERSEIKGVNMLRNLVFVRQYLQNIRSLSPGRVDAPVIEKALQATFPGTSVAGDKYPDYMFRVHNLAREQGVKAVFIYRDPRDVASSSIRKARNEWKNDWPPELREPKFIAQRWVQTIELMQKSQESIFTLRYEDLVTTPKACLEQLGAWLGIDPQGFQHQMVRVDSIGKHAHGLGEIEIAAVLEVAGPAMERMGYEL